MRKKKRKGDWFGLQLALADVRLHERRDLVLIIGFGFRLYYYNYAHTRIHI